MTELQLSPEYCDSDLRLINRAERLSRGLVRCSRISSIKIRTWPTFDESLSGQQMLQVLHFDHDSVKEFMLTKGLNMLEKSLGKSSQPSVPDRHGKAATKFLAFLQADEVVEFADSRQTHESDSMLSNFSFHWPETIEPPHLARYAVLHWPIHALAAEEDTSTLLWMTDHLLAIEKETWTHLAKLHESASQGLSSKFCSESSLFHTLSRCGLVKILSATLDSIRSTDVAGVDLGQLIDASDKGGRTPLFLAAHAGKPESARLLLRNGANANSTSISGLTPLHFAAFQGHVDVQEVLLAQPNIDVDARDRWDRTPLQFALSSCSLPAVQSLLRHTTQGVHSPVTRQFVRFKEGWALSTPVGLAFQLSSIEVLRFLLDSWGANDKAQEPGRDSLLHYIPEFEEGEDCTIAFLERVGVILNSGKFDIDWKGKKGRTPLLAAVKHKAHGVVRLLLQQADVKVDEADDDGITPIVCAVRQSSLDTTKLLLISGKVDVNRLRKSKLETPLLVAVRRGAHKIVMELLKHPDIQPDLADRHGRTPLLEAVFRQDVETTRRLASTGKVDLNVRDANQNPAIHLAIDSDNHQLVKVFLKFGLNVDLKASDALGFPPFVRAVRRGRLMIVVDLLMEDQIPIVDSLGALPLVLSFARDEYEKDPTKQEREGILALLQCLNSKDDVAPSKAYQAVQIVFSKYNESVTFSEIVACLDFARHCIEKRQKEQELLTNHQSSEALLQERSLHTHRAST